MSGCPTHHGPLGPTSGQAGKRSLQALLAGVFVQRLPLPNWQVFAQLWWDGDGMLLAELVGTVVVDIAVVDTVVAVVVAVDGGGAATAAVAGIVQQKYSGKCPVAISYVIVVAVAVAAAVVADADLDVFAELEQILFHFDSLMGKSDTAVLTSDQLVLAVHTPAEKD